MTAAKVKVASKFKEMNTEELKDYIAFNSGQAEISGKIINAAFQELEHRLPPQEFVEFCAVV
jgi:hypothetical protein